MFSNLSLVKTHSRTIRLFSSKSVPVTPELLGYCHQMSSPLHPVLQRLQAGGIFCSTFE